MIKMNDFYLCTVNISGLIIRLPGVILMALFLGSCVKVPEGIETVSGFELDRYLGKWYEIARLDHSFERGLTHVTADYSLRDDGGIKVVNRGYDAKENEWQEAIGKGYFVKSPDSGQLKVSFFGPFYGAYNIIALDKAEYRYALVSGPDHSYLWILARTPELDPEILEDLVTRAKAMKFPTEDLIFVSHQ